MQTLGSFMICTPIEILVENSKKLGNQIFLQNLPLSHHTYDRKTKSQPCPHLSTKYIRAMSGKLAANGKKMCRRPKFYPVHLYNCAGEKNGTLATLCSFVIFVLFPRYDYKIKEGSYQSVQMLIILSLKGTNLRWPNLRNVHQKKCKITIPDFFSFSGNILRLSHNKYISILTIRKI